MEEERIEREEGEIEHCKIRKRGNSSSSSSSLVHHKYRFKRAILLPLKRGGSGGGSSTPVPTWRTAMSAAKSPITASAAAEAATCPRSGESVSARKLAATVWEMNQHSPGRRMKVDSEDSETERRRSRERRNDEKRLPGLSDPTPLLEDGTDRRRNGQRRRTKSKLQLADYNPNLMEVESQAKMGKNQMECVIGTRTRLKDVSNGLLTSKELLKVMNRLWGFNDQNSSGMSLVSALKAEIDRARMQVNQLIKDQRSNRHEIDHLLKSFEEEKAVWRSKERARIRDAISCISEELEVEKKLRKQTERLNKKLGLELADTKEALSRVTMELESEKRAKEILEQVCDELARGVGEDRDLVEEVKRETAKVREEVEKEREMLLIADVLREERVQMKLSEAKYLYEEKNAAVDRLRNELESHLRGGETGKEDGDDSRPDHDRIKELEAYLKEIEFGALHESRENHVRDDEFGALHESRENHVRDDVDSYDGNDSADDTELHSIELEMENINNTNKSYKWSFEGIILDNPKRISVDKDMKGIEWGSISLYKKDSNSNNVNVSGLQLDSDAINLEIQQILDKERQSGLGLDSEEQDVEDDEGRKLKPSAKSLRDFLQSLPLQELNNGVAGTRGESRLSTSSKQ